MWTLNSAYILWSFENKVWEENQTSNSSQLMRIPVRHFW